jgi:hypothetical protein
MMAARCMPRSLYIGTLALVMAAAVVSLLQKQGALESGEGSVILRSYSDFLGLAGVTSLAQVISHSTPPHPSISTFQTLAWIICTSPILQFIG